MRLSPPFFLLVLLAMTAMADEPQATLYWRNRESLAGALVGADASSLTWRTDLVTGPVVLDRSKLLLVDFARPDKPEPTKASWSLLLRNGDCIHGDDARIGGDAITMTCPRHGTVRVPLSAARSLRRLRGEDVLYAGPCGQAGWKGEGFTTDGGALATRQWDQTLQLPLELPAKLSLEIALRSTQLLNFKLTLTQAAHACPTLETWGSDLVLVAPEGSMRFVPLLKLGEGEQSLGLRLLLDLEAGSAQVFDHAGKELGSLKWTPAAPKSPGTGTGPMVPEFGRIRRISVAGKTGSARSSASALVPGIAIKNRGANWVIDELCARRWDGRLPRTVPGDLPCVEFTDGTWKSGDEAKAFDLGQVQSVAWSADVPPLRPKMPRAAAAFADGTMISGSLVSFAGGGFDMRAPWSAGPVHSSGEGLLRIVFEPPASPANEPSPATLDLIHAGSVTIHGSISGDGGKEPLWRFVGGRAALPVAVPSRREDVELTWARPLETEPQAPARSFLITDAGDVLSASILGIDETGVSFASPWTEARTLAHEHARAIRMAARKVESKGFRDSGWGVVKGDDHLAKVTPGEKPDEDMLRLEPGGAFGHPYLGGGDDIRFSMSMPDHYGGLSMEFFAGDGADEHEGLKLMLWRSGNQLYAVAGDANNGVRRDQMLKDDGEAPVSIRIIFNDSKVQLFANESPMLTESVTPAQRRQTGLRLSCASLWGNTMRTMEVSDFSVADHPGSFDAVNVTERAKREALLVPRFRRESPPSHALVAVNGDVIRGRVDAATEKLVRFTSGLETMNMPAERVRNIIWLRKPAPDPKDGSTPPASLAAPPKAAAASHWLVLQDNSRLALTIDAFMPDKVLGRSELLGKFEVPLNKIALLRWAPASATSALKSYTDWQLENAPEPVLPEGGSQASPLLGKAAPDFKLPLLDGGDFELSKMRGQVVVVDFWATWCGPCVASMPDLIQAMKAFEGKKVQFITLNQGEPEAQVRRFLKLRDWKLPVAMDARQEAAGKYGVEGIPHTVLIGTEGKVEWTHTGHTSDGAEKLTEAVKKALHE